MTAQANDGDVKAWMESLGFTQLPDKTWFNNQQGLYQLPNEQATFFYTVTQGARADERRRLIEKVPEDKAASPGTKSYEYGLGWNAAISKVRAILQNQEPQARHPEDYCHRCNGPNVSWSAPSPLWNEVMRGGDINGEMQFDEIICMTCFVQLAKSKGITGFRLYATDVKPDLQTTTPSGRVWNDKTWLWEEPAPAVPVGDLDELRQAMSDQCNALLREDLAVVMRLFEHYITEHYGGRSNV